MASAYFQILSLATLVLSVCLETYSTTTNVAAKQNRKEKKETSTTQLLSEKVRLQLVTSMCVKLKSELADCESALGKRKFKGNLLFSTTNSFMFDISTDIWKTPFCPENILDRLASMSLNPKVEQLVSGTLKESHNITVKELKTIVKEKIRMLK